MVRAWHTCATSWDTARFKSRLIFTGTWSRARTSRGLTAWIQKQVGNKMQPRRNQTETLKRWVRFKLLKIVEAPGRFELPTRGLGNRCSVHLSYGAISFNLRCHFSLQQ